MAPLQIERRAALALAALGLSLGLWGIGWGLPSRERAARVLPPGVPADERLRKDMAESWAKLHAELGPNLMSNPESFTAGALVGVVDVPAGWRTPPPALLSSARSFFLRSEHEDEQSILLALSRMRPKKLEFNPHVFSYGALHIYSVGATLAAGAALGVVPLKSSLSFYLEDPARMAALYMGGRLLTVLMYVVGALLLLRLGRRVGVEAGALGGALYLMMPGAVVQAHVLKNHTYWPVFALLTLDLSGRVLETGKARDYALAGAASGLAVAVFLGAWPSCLVVAAAAALRLLGLHAPRTKAAPWAPELKGLLLAGACSAAAFLLLNPYWVLDHAAASAEMRILSGFSVRDPGQIGVFVTHALRRAATDPLLFAMMGGIGFALYKGRKEPFLLLCAAAFLFGLCAMATVANVTSTRQIRYFMGPAAVGCLLAGRLVAELRSLKDAPGKAASAFAALLLVFMLGQGATYAANFAEGTGETSTHARAGDWIDAHVPAGATIALLRYPQPSNSPFFRWDRYRLRLIDPRVAASLPEKTWPEWLAVSVPDYDDRGILSGVLPRYELSASFPRASLAPWASIEATSTTANPLIEVYHLKGGKK